MKKRYLMFSLLLLAIPAWGNPFFDKQPQGVRQQKTPGAEKLPKLPAPGAPVPSLLPPPLPSPLPKQSSQAPPAAVSPAKAEPVKQPQWQRLGAINGKVVAKNPESGEIVLLADGEAVGGCRAAYPALDCSDKAATAKAGKPALEEKRGETAPAQLDKGVAGAGVDGELPAKAPATAPAATAPAAAAPAAADPAANGAAGGVPAVAPAQQSREKGAPVDRAAAAAKQAAAVTPPQQLQARIALAGGGLVIRADRPINGYRVWRFRDPGRIVIDVPGLKLAAGEAAVVTGKGGLRQVRYGDHGSWGRVVAVYGGKVAPAARVSQSGTRLVLAVQHRKKGHRISAVRHVPASARLSSAARATVPAAH